MGAMTRPEWNGSEVPESEEWEQIDVHECPADDAASNSTEPNWACEQYVSSVVRSLSL